MFFCRVSTNFFYEWTSWIAEDEWPRKLQYGGESLSLSVFQHAYNDKSMFQPLNRFRVIIHSTDELPFRSGRHFFINTNSNDYVDVYVHLRDIDKVLVSWSPENRQCFMKGEKKLKFFRIYTKNNCEHECLSDAMLTTCNCVPFYMIRKLFDQSFGFLKPLNFIRRQR